MHGRGADPDSVPADLIVSSHVPDTAAAYRLRDHLDQRRLAIRVNPTLFFDRSHQ
jgi:hypothetical protein